MTVDSLELEQSVDPLKWDEVDPQRGEYLFELDLERPEAFDRDVPTPEHESDIQVRALSIDRSSLQHCEAVVRPRAEQVNGEELELLADLVEAPP